MTRLWIFIGLNFISKLHGYSDGFFPEVCESMRPLHGRGNTETPPQTSEPPFMVSYQLGSKVGDPITVSLQRKDSVPFMGFMLEARDLSLDGEGPPLGKFIIIDSVQSRLLKCGESEGSAVSNRLNVDKSLVHVNWTSEGDERDIIFRATFSQTFSKYWERVNVRVLRPTSTTEPEPTTTTTAATTTTTAATTTAAATTTTTSATTTTTAATTAAAATTTTAAATTTTTAATTATAAATTTTTAATTTMTAATTIAAAAATTTTMAAATTAKTTTTQMSTTTMQVYTSKATTNTENATKPVDILLMCLNSAFVEMKMQIPNIIMAVNPRRSSNHYLLKSSRIVGSSFSISSSLSTLILYCLCNPLEGILIGLVSTVLVIGFVEWIIAVLPFGPSHELNEICELVLWGCFPFHHCFTTALLYVRINSLTDEWREFWPLHILIAHTVLIGLTVVWNTVLNKRALLHFVKDKAKHRQGHQRNKERVSAVTVAVTVISVILMVGITSLSVAVIVGLF